MCIKKPVNFVYYIYNNYSSIFFKNQALIQHCEVFADVNASYFTSLRWIMNV